MKHLLLGFVLALAAGTAHATVNMVWKAEGVIVRLEPSACVHATVLSFIPDALHNEFRSGTVIFKGKLSALCWAAIDTDVMVIDESGEGGTIPQGSFKREAGI